MTDNREALVLELRAENELDPVVRQAISSVDAFGVSADEAAAMVDKALGRAAARFGSFAKASADAAAQVEDSWKLSLKSVDQLANQIVKSGASGGGIDVGAAKAQESLELARQRLTILQQLEAAEIRNAGAEAQSNPIIQQKIAAYREVIAKEQARIVELGAEVGALEQLQIELKAAGVAEQAFASRQETSRVVSGAARAGMQQLGYQMSDLGTQFSMAAQSSEPMRMALMAITQQGPQVVAAVAMMKEETSGFLAFMSGPYGAGLMAIVAVLGNLAMAHASAAEAEDKHKDSTEDLIKALDELHTATVQQTRSTYASVEANLQDAMAKRARAVETRKAAVEELRLAQAKAASAAASITPGAPGYSNTFNLGEQAKQEAKARELQQQVDRLSQSISTSEGDIRGIRGQLVGMYLAERFDAGAAATGRFSRKQDELNRKLQAGTITQKEYARSLADAMRTRDAETKAARESAKAVHNGATAHERHKKAIDEDAKAIREWYKAMAPNSKAVDDIARAMKIGGEKDNQSMMQDLAAKQRDRTQPYIDAAQYKHDLPTEEYKRQLEKNTGDMNLALDGVKAHGLQSLEDGLLGVINGTESVAGAFKKMANAIIADLARIAIEKAILSIIGFSNGGEVSAAGTVKAATGGLILGAGSGTSDSIPAWLSNGEFVMRAEAVQRIGVGALNALNEGRMPGYASGGLVSPRLPSFSAGGGRGGTTIHEHHWHVNARGAILAEGLVAEMQQVGVRATLGGAQLAQTQMADNSMSALS